MMCCAELHINWLDWFVEVRRREQNRKEMQIKRRRKLYEYEPVRFKARLENYEVINLYRTSIRETFLNMTHVHYKLKVLNSVSSHAVVVIWIPTLVLDKCNFRTCRDQWLVFTCQANWLTGKMAIDWKEIALVDTGYRMGVKSHINTFPRGVTEGLK